MAQDLNNLYLWVFLIFIAPYLIAKGDKWRREKNKDVNEWFAQEAIPAELRASALFLNEADIAIESPLALHGRVDQVFKTKSQSLLLVDTKTRKRFRVYESDIIQLSIYRYILLHQYKIAVEDYAYVRVQIDGRNGAIVKYIKVNLLSESEVEKLVSAN